MIANRLFAIDFRSLALLRMALASISLVDLVLRARDLGAFYTDAGAFPRQAAMWYYDTRFVASLHLISGDTAVQIALFLVAATALVCLLVGYRTRTATAVAWLLLVSLHVRTPPLLHAGDTLLRLLFFWSLFLPLGARYSVDATRNTSSERPPNPHLSAGSAALMLQVAMMYVFSALSKTGVEWHGQASAVHYALQLDFLVTGLGVWLRSHADLLAIMTRLIWYFELIGPVLLFVPVSHTCAPMPAGARFRGHAAGLWPGLRDRTVPVGEPGSPPPVPAEWVLGRSRLHPHRPPGWLTAAESAPALATAVATSCPHPSKAASRCRPVPPWQPGRLANGLCLFFLLYVGAWNVASLPQVAVPIPDTVRWVGELLHIEQAWDMFAPSPSKDNGWMVMPGLLNDGTEVDVYRQRLGAPVWEKPEGVGDYFKSHRWMKFLMTLARQSQGAVPLPTTAAICAGSGILSGRRITRSSANSPSSSSRKNPFSIPPGR